MRSLSPVLAELVDVDIIERNRGHAVVKRKRASDDFESDDKAPCQAIRLGGTLTELMIPATVIQAQLENSAHLASGCLVGVTNVLFVGDTVTDIILKGYRHFRTQLLLLKVLSVLLLLLLLLLLRLLLPLSAAFAL